MSGFIYICDPGSTFKNHRHIDRDLLKRLGSESDNPSSNSIFVVYEDKIYKVWFWGHCSVVLSTVISILFCFLRLTSRTVPNFIYRLSFVLIILTYGLALFQNLKGAPVSFYSLLPLHTFQYASLAFLWLITPPHFVKLLSYSVFSANHVFTRIQSDVKSPKHKELIKRILDDYIPKAVETTAYLDLFMVLQMFVDVLCRKRFSFLSLLVFIFCLRVRTMYVGRTWDAIVVIATLIDNRMIKKETPVKLRNAWIRLKDRVLTKDLRHSEMHSEDTDRAIEQANLDARLR